MEHLEYISEYLDENLWTYRRKIGTFRREKLDAESEYLAEISLFNLFKLPFTSSEHIIKYGKFTPFQPNRKIIPNKTAENGSVRKVTLVR